MTIEFKATKRLGPFSFDAELSAQNEIVVLFGHSGAGKSLTLQMAAGLVRPESGTIVIDGRVVFDRAAGVSLSPQERGVGYVVQDLALFPHMHVRENIAFGARGAARARAQRVAELVAMLGLDGLEDRMPRTLSGGQQQRVALARALARDARLLLLDEPFSALDDSLRAGLRRELIRLRRDLGLTILFVTHDLREAHLLADRIAVFDNGRILQFAPKDDVFRRPSSRRVAELTGTSNVFAGTVAGRSSGRVAVDIGGLCLLAPVVQGVSAAAGESVDVAIRAERVIVHRREPESADNLIEARIVEDLAFGSNHTLRFEPLRGGPEIEVEVAARPYEVMGLAERTVCTLELLPGDIHLMPRLPA
ncbi:MAG: ABC transporter ATP-binding protein [Tepidiformaceae bacterium]